MKDEMKENPNHDDIELTGEDNSVEPDIEEIENSEHIKIKKLQEKLKTCESEKMKCLEDLQRGKAEFLNGKRRLEEERSRDKERAIVQQIERLLPLCDSFHMAMSNTEAWESVDPVWRTGVESIQNQLKGILESYGVTEIRPVGETFDPNLHEAMTEVSVDDESMNNKIVSVVQNGFVRKTGDATELIRPARVTVGILSH